MSGKILIVDSSKSSRKLLSDYLIAQYNTIEADSGKKLGAAINDSTGQLSAVIINVTASAADWEEQLRLIRENELCRGTPVIAVCEQGDEAAQLRAMSQGASSLVFAPVNKELLLYTVSAAIALRERAAASGSEQFDALTGLFNRESFIKTAEKIVHSREAGYYVFSCIDIENFKVINDQYGTETGDRVLKFVADSIARACEALGGVCCRFTGDKFGMLYPAQLRDGETIRELHNKAATSRITGRGFKVRVGRCLADDLSVPVSALYDRATLAEESIRGRYDTFIAEYGDSMRTGIIHEQQIVNEMDAALAAGEFEPWLQPQYNHATGAMIGAEALVRWRKDGAFISPAEFIPVFERNGFIYEMDQYIWEQVCRLLRRWLDEGRTPLPVSINISRRDLAYSGFIDVLTGIVGKYDLPYELLRLEVTESAFSESSGQIVAIVGELIERGFTVEIDDFGSGYSSLNTLKDVPASILKLDMKFFENTKNQQRGGNIIESVIRMAKWLGMAVIAEGVENRAQADFLKSIGCYYIQGFYYARPMPVNEYEKLLDASAKEPELTRLRTLETLDNNEFWNPKSMETLIFNSYVGGACIFEYHDGQTELLRINDRYKAELGCFAPDSALSRKTSPIRFLNEENRARLYESMDEAIRTKSETACELKLKNTETDPEQTGYYRLTFRVIAIAGERYLFYCMVMSMTEQREAEQKRREAELKQVESDRQLKIIMDNINGGVSAILIDDDGSSKFIFSNDRYFELYGYTREQAEAEKLDVMTLIAPDELPGVMEKVKKLKADRLPTIIDYSCRKRDGSYAYLRVNASMMYMEGYGDVVTSVLMDITEKREKEEQMRAIVENIYGGVSATVVKNGKREFIVVNDRFFYILGYESREQYEAECGDKYCCLHPEDRERVIKQFESSDGGKTRYTMEYRILRRDGEVRYIHNSVSVIRIFGFDEPVQLSVATDITDIHISRQKELEATEKLKEIMNNDIRSERETNEQLQFLNDSAHDILAQPDSERAIADTLFRLLRYFEGERAYVVENDYEKGVSDNTYEVCAPGVSHEKERLQDVPLAVSMSWLERLGRGEHIFIDSVADIGEDEAPLRGLLESQGISCLILAPLQRNGRLLGFVGIDNPARATEQVGRLTALADYIAILLTRRDLHRHLDRVSAELLDNLPCGAALYGYDGESISVIHINRRYWELVEREPVDYGKASVLGAIHPEDRAAVRQEIDAAIRQSRDISIFVRILCGESDYRLFFISAKIKPAPDGRSLLYASYSPVSEQACFTANALPPASCAAVSDTADLSYFRDRGLHADFELNTLLNVIPSGVLKYAADDTKEIAYINRSFVESLGYTPEQFREKFHNRFDEVVYSEDREYVEGEILRQEGEGKIGKFEYRIEAADGQLHWFHDEGTRVTDHSGKSWYYVTLIDMTEQMHAQEKLRVSEEMNRLAIEHSGNIITRFDVRERTLSLPASLNKIFALPSVLTNMPDEQIALGRVSPETADSYRELFESIVRGSASGSAVFQQNSIKGWRWLEAQYTTVFSNDARPLSAVITFTDITERLEKEMVYSKWQQSLAERAWDSYTLFRCNLSRGGHHDSREGGLLDIVFDESSTSFEALTAQYLRERVFTEDRERYAAFLNPDYLLAEYYRGHRSDTLEYRELCAGGALRWLRLSVDLVEYPNSRDVEAYLMYENIDEQKQAALLTIERSETDPLTGVLNRTSFISRMEELVQNAKPGEMQALFMLDVDEFKRINDTLGHGAGDKVLTELTKRIKEILRKDDLVGRMGGDEFFVFLSNIPSREAAAKKADQICCMEIETQDADISVTASVGIAMLPQDGADFDTLYKKVDAALYRVKEHGKHGYHFVSAPAD